ncbi:DUF4442 domain-containing protein [Rhodocyclus tenuis]|uniref:DUF4442 domain-containing protein n=1 Tax=Rhodocyclus gracilis TaxID=2929842 RepID=A0ABX0WFU8_9RHOO|nr:DUF4442 domain-containing protein [Rhodocyclus gracilis]NJA88602.1 DUF4442 domain-containing protein [Rhodocyclus gracilis]
MIPSFWNRIPPRWRPALFRFGLNLFPAYRATGGRVVAVAPDMLGARVRLPLGWRTCNGAGTTFGGSLYAATDPLFALLLAVNLGPDYVVWDKAASIRYRRPGRATLFADFRISVEDLRVVRETVAREGRCDRHFHVDFCDAEGVVHAGIDKTVYIGRRHPPSGENQPMPR